MSGMMNGTLKLGSLPRRFALLGGSVMALCLIAAFYDAAVFYRAYLIAFLFWTGVTLGCLAILMMQHLTGGKWALLIRRTLEAGTRTLPLMAVATLPIFAGMKSLYPWAQPNQTDPVIESKHAYLNPTFFLIRMVFYFACWFALTHFLNKWSREEDRGESAALATRMESLSGGGLVLFGFTLNFAAVDWVMSLEPRWYSTIYGLLVMTGMTLAAMAFVIVAVIWLSEREPLSGAITPLLLQDLGSILLMFVMLWAYLEFSQFLIIWGENLSGEIPWYVRRLQGGWGAVELTLVLLNFALPFFLLLFRHIKRRAHSIMLVAILILVMRVLDLCWLVLPAFQDSHAGSAVGIMLVFLLVGMGGLWCGYFLWQLQQLPLLPANDPRMQDFVEHAAEHG